MTQKVPLFKKHPIFSCLSKTEKDLLMEDTEQGRLEPRAYFYQNDKSLRHIYFIISGSYLIGKNLGKAQETILQLSMDSNFLGVHSLIFGQGNYQFAKALSSVRYLKFNKTVFKYILHQNSKFHDLIRKQLGKEFAELETKYLRLHTNTKLHDRLKLFLEELHRKNNKRAIERNRIDLHITHLEIAKYLQGSRQSVSLNLAKMRDEGIIDYSRNWLKVIDLRGLRKWEP